MAFTLQDIVPWGRSFQEYVRMFSLDETALRGRILGCGDGPASFNAVGTRDGYRIVSADPLYGFSAQEIVHRIQEIVATMTEQTRCNAHEFVWTHFHDVDALISTRLNAMRVFLEDYPAGRAAGRYIAASLPALPFRDAQFDLAVCSHFLFLYSDQMSAEFHVDSVLELCRVAREVRVFPLLELGARPSRHVDSVMLQLRAAGLRANRFRVPYEFQKGGNEMLCVSRELRLHPKGELAEHRGGRSRG